MKIGLNFGTTLYEYKPTDLLAVARKAEELGYDSIWCGDHLIVPTVIPRRDVAHPDLPVSKVDSDSPTARVVFSADAPMPDVFLVFAHLAAVTSRISFGTAIYILPLRHPIISARAVGTLDWLSGGRALLGVGLGWLPGEFDILGEDFATRGRRMDECIRIMRELWTQEQPAYQGEFFSFAPARFEPKPIQKPGPPILIGGETDAALRRAALLGDGWCGRLHTPDTLRIHVERLRRLRREFGREDTPFTVQSWLKPRASADDVRALQAAGADQLLMGMHGCKDPAAATLQMERFAEAVLRKL